MKFSIFIIITMLCGCTFQPSMFGMPQSQFQSLTHSQQTQVIDAYNHQQEIRTQNEPIIAAVDTLGLLASEHN